MDNLIFREKLAHEPIPYDDLLLADETVEAIDLYIGSCKIYIIESSVQKVGVCAVQPMNDSEIEIKNIAILEKYRGNGIGSWCILELRNRFPEKDIFVGTGDGSLDALKFYERNGFVRDFVRKDFFLTHYPEPIFENGIQLKDQIVLKLPSTTNT